MVASSTAAARSIVIFGATGAQGGSVLAHLLKSDRPYRITAVTRDPSKASSKAIAAKGVNVIKAELGDKEQVLAALKEGELVFAVTNFWEHGREKELADGRRLMDAAKQVGTKTFYWSGLEPVSKITSGKYTKVEHFDTKVRTQLCTVWFLRLTVCFVKQAELLEYGRSLGLPIVDVQPAMYMQNFLSQMGPRKQEDGSYVFAMPNKPDSTLSLLDAAGDYGAFVRGAIETDVPAGGEVLACGDQITPVQLAEQWGKALGKKASYHPVDATTFASQAGEEITQMLQYFSEFGYFGGKDVGPSKKVLAKDEKVQTWFEFVKTADWSKVVS
ncbi:hypothetical protein QFC19_003356 [Naganishia cerealis]|uniref:Uncharacterized protein n=1 Tax=Naganishia cerealis TaxID=610337 RepID=A0ACC2W4H2_9TREE|nr:hypothetical protein QFC19_003356 [Naganishia cerealis]